MGRIGSLAGYSLELAPGSTVITAFMATLTTAMILITDTLDRSRSAGRSSSTTSRQTRRGTGKATQATRPIMGVANMPSPDTMAAAAAAVTTKSI
jgi:hypothetical protein